MSQNEKIDSINHLYMSYGRKKLREEDITDSLIEKLYDLMFLSIEFNVDEIIDSNELFYFGSYYHIIKDYDKMKRYYLRAIELNNDNAMNNLAYYYYNVEKNYDLMRKYYVMAVQRGNKLSMNNLAYYYYNVEKNYDLMRKYYVMAVQRGNKMAIKNFNNYYLCNTDYSFLELYDCNHFKKRCTVLINIRFKCDNIINLPENYKKLFLKLDFTNNENISAIVKIKQNIYKLTFIFPLNYNSKYLEQFRAIESIVQNNECTTLNKDLLLHIAGRLFI